MLVDIKTFDNHAYRFASETVVIDNLIYQGRLRDELSLSKKMSESGNAPVSQNITIYNGDNAISRGQNFWGANLVLTSDSNQKWTGKVTFYNFDSDGNLYLTASEKGAPELEKQLPDEVRQVYTIDSNFHQSSVTMTIPLAIGGSSSNPILLPTILIDKTRGIYLVCVGEIRRIVKVLRGAEELPATAYSTFCGSSNQPLHPGFAYVQINEDYRKNDDESYAEINVEVVGLKLGNHSEEECRNGARFLYYFLKTASNGINGWGCGVPEDEIDVDSFNSAIAKVDLMGLKLDGVMWLRQSAQSWIDQICQAIHGQYSINSNGKRSLFIDYAGASSKKTFNANKMILNRQGKNNYTGAVYNKGILSYGYNPITGLFIQSAQFEDAQSIEQIGEQKFVGESYLVNDAHTALAVLEYTCKRSLTSAEAVDFTTDDLTTNLYAGDIITIDRPDVGITGDYQITSISTSDYKSEITAVKFDTSVFVVTGSNNNVNWNNDKQISSSVVPGEPTNLSLSTNCDIMSDGTANVYISGTFTPPEGNWLFAAVQYGETDSPANWTELSLIENGSFKISSLKSNTVYSIRVRMVTVTGHSDYVKGIITTAGDSIAPAVPALTATSYLKTIKLSVVLENPPSDLAGFEIYRSNIQGNNGDKIGYVSAVNGSASYVDIDAANYLTDFYYSAKSIDKWGNSSDYSTQAVANCAKIQASEVESDWVISNLMETSRGVGIDVDGVKIDSSGIEGWYDGKRYIDLNSASGSTIAGWNIEEGRLFGNNIELVSDGVIRTMDYVSGHSGWQINSEGKAEFQDATIRGTLTSVNFVKDTISAVGGFLMIIGAAEVQEFIKTTQNYQAILTEDCIDLVTEDGDILISEQTDTSIYYRVTVDDASTFNGGDILRIRNADTVQDLWLGVASKSSNILNCVMLYGTAMDLESGMCAVNYRQSGNGGILLNGNNPSVDLYNHNGKPWIGTNLLARIGNLNGVNGIVEDRYGFFFGDSDRSHSNRHYITWNDQSNELEISGRLKAATGSFSGELVAARGTFSGELVAAKGSFTGEVVANSGKIGLFDVSQDGLLSVTSNILSTTSAAISLNNYSVSTSEGTFHNDINFANINLTHYGVNRSYKQSIGISSSILRLEYSPNNADATRGLLLFPGEIMLDFKYDSGIQNYSFGVTEGGISFLKYKEGSRFVDCYISSTDISIKNLQNNTYVSMQSNGNFVASGVVISQNGTCSGSAEETKTNITTVDVLNRLRSLKIKRWNYKTDLQTSHIGPMAKDFNEAFEVNQESNKNINYTDSIGVALRAIQELAEKVDELEAKLYD